MVKRFGNIPSKIKTVLSVFEEKEKLKTRDITSRLKERGYNTDDGHVGMFIYHNMLYKHLERENVKGVNYYSLI